MDSGMPVILTLEEAWRDKHTMPHNKLNYWFPSMFVGGSVTWFEKAAIITLEYLFDIINNFL